MESLTVEVILGIYPLPVLEGIVPGSDGVGEVIAVGDRVDKFKVGDLVMPFLFNTNYTGGSAPPNEARNATFGGSLHGVFRGHGIFEQGGLVAVPPSLTYEEGAVVQGPFGTAWNSLMGGASKLQVGDCVLVQGSGVVSIGTIQIAAAAGAVVIATTSSDAKGEKLKKLGAHHVINYTKDKHWGATAKKLSPGGLGCKFVVDVVGSPDSYRQSLEAVAAGGEISVVGFIETAATSEQRGPSYFETLMKPCTVRGIQCCSRMQLEEVCYAIEAGGIKPVYDERVFELKDLKGAYEYLMTQGNFGKIVVRIP